MLFIKPEAVVFEKQEDVIDYITLGLPPSGRNFESIMEALHTSYRDDVCIDKGARDGQNDLIIKQNIIPDEIDLDVYEQILKRTYQNRLVNTAFGAGLIVVAGVAGFFIGKSIGREDARYFYENNR